jgi:hypothetical protein
MAVFDKSIKSNRLLQSKRYTRASADSQEAFTQVIDLGAGEIYSQVNLIPTSSIPYSSSAQDRQFGKGTDGLTNISQYFYRLQLTPDDQGNNSYFALSTPVTNADPQTVQTTQLTNWLSNKYVNPSFAATANAEAQSPSPVGYTIALSYGPTTSSVTSISPNDYQFDYKAGVIQFLTSPPGTIRGDFGVSVGLLNHSWWEYSRFYYVNIERTAEADKLGPHNINISFTNGGLLNIDVMVFIFYSDQFTIDVNTGIVTK